MDPSGSELQELRRLVGELTARVFRIEQALNLPSGVAAEASPRAQVPAPLPPPAEPNRSGPDIPSQPAAYFVGKPAAVRTWNPASVRTG